MYDLSMYILMYNSLPWNYNSIIFLDYILFLAGTESKGFLERFQNARFVARHCRGAVHVRWPLQRLIRAAYARRHCNYVTPIQIYVDVLFVVFFTLNIILYSHVVHFRLILLIFILLEFLGLFFFTNLLLCWLDFVFK